MKNKYFSIKVSGLSLNLYKDLTFDEKGKVLQLLSDEFTFVVNSIYSQTKDLNSVVNVLKERNI